MPKIWKQPNGVWRCDIQVRGKRYFVKNKSRDKVVERVGELLQAKKAPPKVDEGESFVKVALAFLESKRAIASAGAFRHYEHHVNKKGGMLDAFEGRRYSSVTLADYKAFLEHRLLTKSRRGKNVAGKLLSPQTVEHERAILVQIALWAEERGKVDRAPLTSRTLKRLKVPEARVRVFSDADLSALLEVCPDELRPLLTIFLFSGLRLAEAERMTWQWIDLEARTLTVGGAGSKSKLSDTIPITAPLLAVLESLPNKRGKVIEGNFGPLLVGGTAPIYAQLRKIARQAGIERFGLHAFRHTFLVNTLRATKSRHVTERAGRHRDPRQMERYARLVPDELVDDFEAAAKRLEAITRVKAISVRRAKKG
jgi:integrase